MSDKVQKILSTGLAQLGIALPDDSSRRILLYLDELMKWNRKMNLVGAAPANELIESHFLDSLTLLPFTDTLIPGDRILDIGTGAGFPGLVLKAAAPALDITLAEPRQKRCAFLRHASRCMGLNDVRVLDLFLRPEDPPVALTGQFSLVVSRAVTDLADFLRLAHPFTRHGGMVVCMKGPKAETELAAWQESGAQREKYELGEIKSFTLPFCNAERHLVMFTKK